MKVVIHGTSAEWNQVKVSLKEQYAKLTSRPYSDSKLESLVHTEFSALKEPHSPPVNLYTERQSSFWSSATGLINETIQIPIPDQFCGVDKYCWGSTRVQHLQQVYLRKIYDLYEHGGFSDNTFSDLWYNFPYRHTFDSCSCTEKTQNYTNVTDLQERFYRRVWLDFLDGEPRSFELAAKYLGDTAFKVPKSGATSCYERWSETKYYKLPIAPKQILAWCLRLAYLGVKTAQVNLRNLAYRGHLGSILAIDFGLNLDNRLKLLKKCVFQYEECLGSMNLWFAAQYQELDNDPLPLTSDVRCDIFERLIKWDLSRSSSFCVCVGSFIEDINYKVNDISRVKLRQVALNCGLGTARQRLEILYQRALTGDHSSLRWFLLGCQDVRDVVHDNNLALFEAAHIPLEEKKRWFDTLRGLNADLTQYVMKEKKQRELGTSSSYYEWLSTQPSLMEDYVKHVTYEKKPDQKMVRYAIQGSQEAWSWCARRTLRSDPDAQLSKAMWTEFFVRIENGSLISQFNGLPDFFKAQERHRTAWITCICQLFALLHKKPTHKPNFK